VLNIELPEYALTFSSRAQFARQSLRGAQNLRWGVEKNVEFTGKFAWHNHCNGAFATWSCADAPL